jgi:hypothetical protein
MRALQTFLARARWSCLALAALATMGLGACGRSGPAQPSPKRAGARAPMALRSCPPAVRHLGTIVLATAAGLELIDLRGCSVRVLADVDAWTARFSPDGRWVAYSRLAGYTFAGLQVVPTDGGRARSPLGGGIVAWSWAPRRELLYGLTRDGSLLEASPTSRRRVIATHLGTSPYPSRLAVSPSGERVAFQRPRCPQSGAVVTINVRTGASTVVSTERGGSPVLAGFSPDGRWLLFWRDPDCSASLAADGSGLEALPAAGGRSVSAISHMLQFPDFLTWCGRKLIAAASPDRETQTGSKLVATTPPSWRQRTIQPAPSLSWVSPSCAPSRRLLAVAAGADDAPTGFGLEHRSIWLLRPDGAVVRRMASPPAGELSDEAPRFSRDTDWILFVQSRVVTPAYSPAHGQYPMPISRDTIELIPTLGGRPVPVIDFTSHDFSYYDHFRWPEEIDWYQPR